MNVISPETRMMGLPHGEEIATVGRTMWTQSTSVTDRQTDRITIPKTVQRIASHGKNQQYLRNRETVEDRAKVTKDGRTDGVQHFMPKDDEKSAHNKHVGH